MVWLWSYEFKFFKRKQYGKTVFLPWVTLLTSLAAINFWKKQNIFTFRVLLDSFFSHVTFLWTLYFDFLGWESWNVSIDNESHDSSGIWNKSALVKSSKANQILRSRGVVQSLINILVPSNPKLHATKSCDCLLIIYKHRFYSFFPLVLLFNVMAHWRCRLPIVLLRGRRAFVGCLCSQHSPLNSELNQRCYSPKPVRHFALIFVLLRPSSQ